jgi:fructose/tagatose bisphosphate aldolase
MNYPTACCGVSKIERNDRVGPVLFEIARTEIDYTLQRPEEYTCAVLAAALKIGYRGPVFMQGDHFQINAKKFEKDPDGEVKAVKDLIWEALDAGFYNIDIDTSTLVDLSKATVKEQQRTNFSLAAELTTMIRDLEPAGITVSVGGDIGEVGGKNSTVEELRAFMDGYLEELEKGGESLKGISKISVQTGTSHGGVLLPDGSVAEVSLDFAVLEKLSVLAREAYGLSGAVQHGASTLPEEAFHRFPAIGTAEIHLATGFQNLIGDRRFPFRNLQMRCPVACRLHGGRKNQRILAPGFGSRSKVRTVRLSAVSVARSMPRDSTPMSFVGFKLTTTAIFLPTSSSGL